MNMPADHVHDDAEVIEHVIGEETVRKLERLLKYPTLDPHGRMIPGIRDLSHGEDSGRDGVNGFGRPL
jgi:manganese/zinc/iron transport system permease protein